MISRQSDEPSIDFVLLKARLVELYPDYEVVMLTRQLKISFSYAFHILSQMYHIATSKVVVLDSYCIPISVLSHKNGLIVIQMWHSMGSMKDLGYAMIGKEEGRSEDIAKILKMHENYSYVIISSMDYVGAYERGFHISRDVVREIPLPRTDLLINKDYMNSLRNEIIKKRPVLGEKKNIAYCPTFRVNETEKDYEAIKKLFAAIDKEKYNIIYKPHPVSNIILEEEYLTTDISDNVSLIAISDYVISDYSSIIYEFGIAEKPVFLYGYDWNEYKDRRSFDLDPSKDIPAFFSENPEAIANAIENEDFDWTIFKNFVDKNVRMPEGLCVDKLIDLMNLD